MSNGFTGIILRVNLSSGTVTKQEMPEEFYRTYMGGGAVGAYFLLSETPGDLSPLDPGNILTIAPSCPPSGERDWNIARADHR